jgi:aminoglycoside/choline kinase family phosphotransferase
MSPKRAVLRHQFLAQHNYLPEHLEFLASDMSIRQYYRLKQAQRILMDAPTPENPNQFIILAQYLQEQGLRTPLVYDHQLEHGFVWLEDFGDQTYSKILLQTPEREAELYHLAVNILQHLHQQAQRQPAFIEEYTIDELLNEVGVFIDWYWPVTQTQSSYPKAKEDFLSAWQEVLLKMPFLPHSLVLRDYHVDNLMIVSGEHPLQQCGLLDFQDALWGPVVYDFISLIEDARRDVSPDLQEQLWNLFLKEVPLSQHVDYRLGATILGASRHVKVIGVFTRFALRRNRKDYLQHLPRLWNYLLKAFEQPVLEPVHNWFESYLPLSKQSIPNL